MSKAKTLLVSLCAIGAAALAVAGIVGASMGCVHALILLVPAALLAIYPLTVLVKNIKAKLSHNR